MAVPDVEYIVPPPGYEDYHASEPNMKRHKVLPHPTSGSKRASRKDDRRSSGPALSEKNSGSLSSPHTLRHQRRQISEGPDLPPTPPAHSRNPSSSYSVIVTSPSPILPQTPDQSSENVPARTTAPSTPPNQRSPPTPDVTPPQYSKRPAALRPPLYDRIPSKTTTDSRTESFKTARETPESSESSGSSDAGGGKSTLRPGIPSARTSQNTVRQIKTNDHNKGPHLSQVGLGLDLESRSEKRKSTPKSKREFVAFDGEWGSSSEVEQEWDDNLMRNVTVRKRQSKTQIDGQRDELVDDMPASPTNVTKAVRAMPLPGKVLTYASPRESFKPKRGFTTPPQPIFESPINTDVRRLSGMSTRSNVSTIVEAILVDTPTQRRRTLRHVKAVEALRESSFGVSSESSTPSTTSIGLGDSRSRRRPVGEFRDATRESYASNGTVNSISSRKARRDVWKNGGIPVVVVPDRRSSHRSSSRERSLRSSSSKRSNKRSPSLKDAPHLSQISKSHDMTHYFDRPLRRGRTMSESDGSSPGDQRTMDYPPVVPRRTSSLSAPTSRNGSRSGSRTGSLTAESLEIHDALQNNSGIQLVTDHTPVRSVSQLPIVTVRAAPPDSPKSSEGHKEDDTHSQRQHSGNELSADRYADHGRRRASQATPFSQASVDTSGMSAAEISEAMAVSIMPHQNKSVLMVDHRLSDCSDVDQRSQLTEKAIPAQQERLERPTITTTKPDGVGPVTPPQATFSMDDVDSPLINPRDPPAPPAIQFIPATPSGLTPTEDKERMLGNYFEETDEKPIGAVALVRRALSKRRHSYGPSPVREARPNFLTRTFSLSRNARTDPVDDSTAIDGEPVSAYPTMGDRPRDETRLYPGWRPANSEYSGSDDGVYDLDDDEDDVMRYPRIDNRPLPPKRSLSSRMQRIFAIMPLEDEYDAYRTEGKHDGGPDRRTIRRTPSGNLRVVKHRGSVGSLRHMKSNKNSERPYTAPEGSGNRLRRVFRSYSLSSRDRQRSQDRDNTDEPEPKIENGRGSGKVGGKFAEYNLQSLPRRLSEKRREKRSKELRQRISAPREVRDGVGDVIRRNNPREAFTQAAHMV